MPTPALPEPASTPAEVLAVLAALLHEERAMRDAVVRRDCDDLTGSVERSQALLTRLESLLSAVGEARSAGTLGRADEARIGALRDELRATARQNAVLIERAWGFDASALRLIAGVGRHASDGSAAGAYAAVPAPTYLDRSA